MAGFDDLLATALPYLDWEEMAVTQGSTWTWSYLLVDDDDDLVDMTSGFTAGLSIRSRGGTVDVVPVTVSFPAPGAITCFASAITTDAAVPGLYYHELTVTRTSDSAVLIAVGAEDSRFLIQRKVAL